MKAGCSQTAHATGILYLILTDCALRLVLRAGLRVAPSLSSSLLYRAKTAGRSLIHAARAATACLGCGVQCAALLNDDCWATCTATTLVGSTVIQAIYLALAVDGLFGEKLGRRRGVVAAAAVGLPAALLARQSIARYALYWALFCLTKQSLQMALWRYRG